MKSKYCLFCNNEHRKKGKFCCKEHYWKWMKGKSLVDIFGEEKALQRSKMYEEKVYSKRRNYTYQDYYGEEKAKIIKSKKSLACIGKKRNISDFRKGKTLEELYGIIKAKNIKQKQSKARLGKHPWNFGVHIRSNDNLIKFGRSKENRGYFNGIYYQSLSELVCIKLFHSMDNVESIDRCHFWVWYKDEFGDYRRYFPDFEVNLKDGDKIIIEVKPVYCYSKNVINKCIALSDYCWINNYKMIMFPAINDKCYNNVISLLTYDLKENCNKGFEIMIPTGHE